jgi:hypothetical protein
LASYKSLRLLTGNNSTWWCRERRTNVVMYLVFSLGMLQPTTWYPKDFYLLNSRRTPEVPKFSAAWYMPHFRWLCRTKQINKSPDEGSCSLLEVVALLSRILFVLWQTMFQPKSPSLCHLFFSKVVHVMNLRSLDVHIFK